jgi:hypothetical protein
LFEEHSHERPKLVESHITSNGRFQLIVVSVQPSREQPSRLGGIRLERLEQEAKHANTIDEHR